MAFVISSDCIACGTCAGECPADAIALGAEHYEINQDACVGCSTCFEVCPISAINEE